MKVRVTLMTENDVPVSELGENPEQKVKAIWDILMSLIVMQSGDDKGYVEKIEILEEE